MGYLGSLSQDPLGRIFSKCAFLNLLSPLALPLPSNVLGSSKKLKFFPRGCGGGTFGGKKQSIELRILLNSSKFHLLSDDTVQLASTKLGKRLPLAFRSHPMRSPAFWRTSTSSMQQTPTSGNWFQPRRPP